MERLYYGIICYGTLIAKNVFDYRDTKIEGIKPTVTKNICDLYKETSLVEEYKNKDIIELEMNHTKIMNSENFQENDRRIVGFLITYDIKKMVMFFIYMKEEMLLGQLRSVTL